MPNVGTAFVTIVPRTAPGFSSQLQAQTRGPLAALGAGVGKVGLALGAGLVAGAAVGGAAIVSFSAKLDEGTRSIRAATGATGEDLEALGQNFRNIVGSVAGAEVEDFATAIGDLNTRTGATGPALEELATQAVRLAKVTGEDLGGIIESSTRAFGDWGVELDDQADTLDRFFLVSQSTGIGVDKLQRQLVAYGAPLRQLGFGLEESAALLGKFEQEGVNAELVMGSMRIALGKMAREGEPAVETFGRVTDQIKNAGSASEANALALELFGARAGPDMAAAIREGRFEVDELMASLEASPETLEAAADESASFGEKFSASMQRLGVALEPIGQAVIEFANETVIPAVEKVVDVVTELADVFEEEGFSGVWARISEGAAELWPRVQAWLVETANQVVAWLGEQAPIWGAALLDLLRRAAEWLLEAIPPFLENLGRWIGAALEWLVDVGLPELWRVLTEDVAPALWEWIQEAVPPFLEEMGKLLLSLLEWIATEAIPKLVEKGVDWIGALLGWLATDAVPWMLEKAAELLLALGDWIVTEAVPTVATKAAELVGSILGWLVDAAVEAPGKLLELFGSIATWLRDEAPGLIADAASGLWDGLLDALKSVLRGLLELWNSLDLSFSVPDIPGVPHRGESFDIIPDIAIPAVLLAEGGTLRRDSLSVVGEEGVPELLSLPRGSTVVPLDVARMIGAAAVAGVAGAGLSSGRGTTIERLEVVNPVDATADETVAAIDRKLGWTDTGREDR